MDGRAEDVNGSSDTNWHISGLGSGLYLTDDSYCYYHILETPGRMNL